MCVRAWEQRDARNARKARAKLRKKCKKVRRAKKRDSAKKIKKAKEGEREKGGMCCVTCANVCAHMGAARGEFAFVGAKRGEIHVCVVSMCVRAWEQRDARNARKARAKQRKECKEVCVNVDVCMGAKRGETCKGGEEVRKQEREARAKRIKKGKGGEVCAV